MIPVADLIRDHRSLVNELARYDYTSVAPLVGGFLTLPDYHANTLRLDALAHLACCACTGKRTADREMLVKCAGKHFVGSPLIPMEDPVEDAFIGNIATNFGNFRVFRGIEESGDFWVEQLLRPLEDTGLPEPLKPIIKYVRALLTISDAVAERLKLKRYSFGSGKLRGRLETPQWRALIASSQAVTFSSSDIQKLGISQEDLIPFILTNEKRGDLANQITGHSDLERCPIIQFGDSLVLACPHTVTASVRRFIIEFLSTSGFLKIFETLLHHQQVEAWFDALRHRFHFKPIDVDLPEPPSGFPMFYQTVMSFDHGKYAHLILLDGNIKGQLVYSHEPDRVSDEQQKVFEAYLAASSEALKKLPDYNGGMSIITRGGIGRGLLLGFRTMPDGWHIEFASLPDWHTLAGCEDMSALRLWRMAQQRHWAKNHGLEIHNVNGPLNLYAAWRANGWRFLHRNMSLENLHKMLALEIDFLAGVRKKVEQDKDEHSCPAHNGSGWIRVERRYPQASSKDKTASIYIAKNAISEGQLVGLIETPVRVWWITTKIKPETPEGRDAVFQLWDCLLNWMERAVPQIEQKISALPLGSVCVEIDFLHLDKWSDHSVEYLVNVASELPTTVVNSTERKIIITIPADFKNEFHVPDNRAERILVGSVVTAISELAGTILSENERDDLLTRIFPNDEARFFHVVRTENLVQMLAEPGPPSPDFIPEEDCAQSLIGLAEEVGDVPLGGKVEGQTECLKYLESVSNKLWERIENGLTRFNLQAVIMGCFGALAELEKDDEHWGMTARALLALQTDDKDALQEAEERHGKRSAASLTNRLLAETAMYVCPQIGGGILPCAERLELLAHLKNLISVANHRDAISGGFMPAEVHVFPNGELDVDDRFYESVMIPYSQALFSKGFRSMADRYESWFSSYERPSSPEMEDTLNRLEEPFREEFGLTLDEFVLIHIQLDKYALKTKNLFLEFDEQSLMSFLKNECKLDENSSKAYISRFTLPPRRAWDKDLPRGCKANDVWPWRFRRQLSMLMRPLVLLSNNPSKRWLVYPPLVQKSCAYVLNGIAEATFPTEHFQSEAMLKFWGDQANRQGNEFTHVVANHAEGLGFTTCREVFMSRLGVPAAIGDFGDVDVLAWKTNSSDVFIIECKYLRTAKTVRDVVDRLDEYRGERDDSLGKHLRRLNWLKYNPATVSALTGIPTATIRFKGLLVTDDLVPMQFFNGSLISLQDVVSLNQLGKVLA